MTNKSKKASAIFRFYKKQYTVIRNEKTTLTIVTVAMLVSFLIGFIFPELFSDMIWSLLEGIVSQIEGKSFFGMAQFIFFNNARSTLIAILLGMTIIFPLFSAGLNGYIIGMVIREFIAQEGFIVFLKFIPHGIFEIPALLLAMAFGLRVGLDFTKDIKTLFSKKKIKERGALVRAMAIYASIVVPLLLIASIVETGLIFFLR